MWGCSRVVGGHRALWGPCGSVRRRLCMVCGGRRQLCFLGVVYSSTVGTSASQSRASQSRGKKWRIDLYEYGGVSLFVVASSQVVVIAGPVSFTRHEVSGTVWSDIWSGVR
ncbi:hypothetical protein DEO72_LG8g1752 [Vigna unguiculata]|uniref:Uncharacterized protein n=1 Tax=Vigna unguiculata TaxID=3917 RepID=A0A4D6MV01_VIGUN|nr:hypothetical protein DEO72_LG8g1752 [Vigna unguiculata]